MGQVQGFDKFDSWPTEVSKKLVVGKGRDDVDTVLAGYEIRDAEQEANE
jgi:hypothetical protein